MISSIGLVPPIVYPQPDGYGHAGPLVTVTSIDSGMTVDVHISAGSDQQLPDGTILPLATVITPENSVVGFLPAGATMTGDGWPAAIGPFGQDAWLVSTMPETSALSKPPWNTVPRPAYWVLEGVDRTSLTALFDAWLSKEGVPGVQPRTAEARDALAPGDVTSHAEDVWRAGMIAGTWQEKVAPEVALGNAAPDGPDARLTIHAFAADGTSLPAAGILAAFAIADKDLLSSHPVVTGAATYAADLPVRFFLRFDVWDVDATSPDDAKGGPTALQPDRVDLIDASTQSPITGSAWTWQGPYGILEIPRSSVAGKTFWAGAEFPAETRVRLDHAVARFWPETATSWTWSTQGWLATDGRTPGTWTAFDGILAGTETQPVTFWVGSKVRLALAYQQQHREWYGKHDPANQQLTTHRVAPGHQLSLFRGDPDPVDTFVTDDDGEVSGVTFGLQPGDTVTAGLLRQLEMKSATGGTSALLLAIDDPAASSTSPALFPDIYFRSENAAVQVPFPGFPSGVIGATTGPAVITIDADIQDDSRGNTADAAAFHGLKYACFTYEAAALLTGNDKNLPSRHELRFRRDPNSDTVADTSEQLATATAPARTYTRMPSNTIWFSSHLVVHEFGHALVDWLGATLKDQVRQAAYSMAMSAIYGRLKTEMAQAKAVHSEGLITNSGVALSEGLAQFFECLMGSYNTFASGGTSLKAVTMPAPPGPPGWPQFGYQATISSAGTSAQVFLANDSARRVEGAFATALFRYLRDATGFPGFLVEKGDNATGSRPPQACLDDWTATLSPAQRSFRPAQLKRLFTWLVTGAIAGVQGGPVSDWTGRWPLPPDPAAVPYPAVYDYLRRLQLNDPDKTGTSLSQEESFQYLFDTCLVPWNFEPLDANEPTPPQLDPDWKP